MAQPKRVGHLVINVKDVATSVKFYTEVLGFEIALERPGMGTFLTCGKIQSQGLRAGTWDRNLPDPAGPGLNPVPTLHS